MSLNRRLLCLSLSRMVLCVILYLNLFPYWKNCKKPSNDVWESCSAHSEYGVVCLSSPCFWGGCHSSGFSSSSNNNNNTVSDQCTYSTPADFDVQESSCSAYVTYSCSCGYFVVFMSAIVGFNVLIGLLEIVFQCFLGIDMLLDDFNSVASRRDTKDQKDESLFSFLLHPIHSFHGFLETVYAVEVVILVILEGLLTAGVSCTGKTDNIDDDQYVNGKTYFPDRTINVGSCVMKISLLLFAHYYILLMYMALHEWLVRRKSVKDSFWPLLRLDFILRYIALNAVRAFSFAVHFGTPILCILWPMRDDGVKFIPSGGNESSLAASDVEKVNSSITESNKVDTTAVAFSPDSSGHHSWNALARNTIIVAILKCFAAIMLVLLLETDWKYCHSPGDDIADSCSITVEGKNLTASCGFFNYLGSDCIVEGYNVYTSTSGRVYNESYGGPHNLGECWIYGSFEDDVVSSACTATVLNKEYCYSWWVLTATVAIFNLIHLAVQIYFVKNVKLTDPHKDLYNLMYFGNARGGIVDNLRWYTRPTHGFLCFIELVYLTYVLILFMFSEGIGIMSYSPICKALTETDSMFIPLKNINLQVVIGNCVAFAAKEAYKVNLFLSIQSFRNKESWWNVTKPLLRLDLSLLYLSTIFWLGNLYAVHLFICCLKKCTGWNDPELYPLPLPQQPKHQLIVAEERKGKLGAVNTTVLNELFAKDDVESRKKSVWIPKL